MTYVPTYAIEFPDWSTDEACAHMARREHWVDQSWHNDSCPSFVCDVFVLWCDHADAAQREIPETPRFSLTDEGRTVLATDSFGDVLAFLNGERLQFSTGGTLRTLLALECEAKRPCADLIAELSAMFDKSEVEQALFLESFTLNTRLA